MYSMACERILKKPYEQGAVKLNLKDNITGQMLG